MSDARPAVVTSPSVLMMTAADVATRDNVTKQAVTKIVREYADKGLTVERDGRGRVVRFNVAEYDHLRARIGDPSKDQRPGDLLSGAAPAAPPAPAKPFVDPKETYDEALRQKTWHEAERRRLELDELKGKLVRKDRIADALSACGEEIVRRIDALASYADDLALAYDRGGTHAVRVELKTIAGKIRGEIAAGLSEIAAGADVIEREDPSEET